MDALVKFSFRDYTTEGRSIGTQSITIKYSDIKNYVKEAQELESLKATEKLGRMFGVVMDFENVKPVFRTNIMIRNYKTNKLIKWAHLV